MVKFVVPDTHGGRNGHTSSLVYLAAVFARFEGVNWLRAQRPQCGCQPLYSMKCEARLILLLHECTSPLFETLRPSFNLSS